MSNLLLFLNLMSGCPSTTVEDLTKITWALKDSQAYQKAQIGCQERFPGTAPCLVRFIKKNEVVYYAICGGTTGKIPDSIGGDRYWFSISQNEISNGESSESGGQTTCCPGCSRTCSGKQIPSGGGK